jgi:hypothetical protein
MQNLQIQNALNAYNSGVFYATMSDEMVLVFPEADHPLTGKSDAVFQINAISEETCAVSFLDADGYPIDMEFCKIEGLAASIEKDMIACGYKGGYNA